jgi:CHAT domain-containing protein
MKEIEGTDVVFLVACETGVGHIDGHQLASVRHAFTLAGAKTVIGTSWKVPANEATKLALQFYGYNWAPGKANDPDAALHYSQLELIQNLRMGHRVGQARVERQAHPYFWASFSTTGIHND